MDIHAKDKAYVGRDNPPVPIEITKADGSFLYGPQGERYIDFIMGWCVGNLGWGRKEIQKRLKAFDGPDYVNPYYIYKPWVELAQRLAEITPGNLKKSFRATGGTEAVEIALQAAMAYTKRNKFVSLEGSYHGHSIGAMSIGDSGFRKYYSNLLPGCHKIQAPLNANTAKEVERILSKKNVAAYISEPIVCNLTVEIPHEEYFEIVQGACKRYGTLFIIDEVATGFGRTGKLFASEYYSLQPDIMCMAKGITGGYGGLGVTMMTDEVAKSLPSFYSTYGWHPLGVEAALATLDILISQEEKIMEHVGHMSAYFKDGLERMNYRYEADIRIKGLAIGIRFQKKGYATDIVKRCAEKKLLLSDSGEYGLTMFPALNISKQTAKEGLDIFQSCI